MTTPLNSAASVTPENARSVVDDAVSRPPEDVARAVTFLLAQPCGDPATDAAVVDALVAQRSVGEALTPIPVEALLGLVRRTADRARNDRGDARRTGRGLLDVVRHSAVVRRIDPDDRAAWSDALLELVEATEFTVGPLFRQRAERYGSKTLFEIPGTPRARALSWRQTAHRVESIARGLIALDPEGEPAPVAILSENRPEMALVDLACLTSGIFDVMIPGTSTESDVGYILAHAKVRTLIVSNERQLEKVRAVRDRCPDLRHIVMLAPSGEPPRDVRTLDQIVARADEIPAETIVERSEALDVDDVATVMYTSGTTGTPKGIRFSHRNIVFKRFARGLALPEVGEHDVLLCYLPLFHTFGRYLEMLGAVYWGATYCFLENPSVEALVRGMRRYRPTGFISVPKKWIQLYEAVEHRADTLNGTDDEIAGAVREVTGGRLSWGLSAAGYLNAEIFRFFQRQGIELMSGFGMTEATGGITMTPPGRYKDDSLGVPLPGVEAKLEEDGELLVRGPYVMVGYLDPPDGDTGFDEQGWFATGDLMERDREGHIKLVDRKKEIYKNVKGETIAPQRVENQFRDLDAVARVFLVGDHREYNTALIYPNLDAPGQNLRALGPDELKAHFRSLVVTVNRFLSPFERIVDFAIIDRDLDADRGELTPKGTPRRKTVERNFSDVIDRLYRRATLSVGGVELLFPNWLFQALALTAQDIEVRNGRLWLPGRREGLVIERIDDRTARVGSCRYRHVRGSVDLGAILTAPRLWLGNVELFDFVEIDLTARQRPGRTVGGLEWLGHVEPHEISDSEVRDLRNALRTAEWSLSDVHRAAAAIASDDLRASLDAVDLLERMVVESEGRLVQPALSVLTRGAGLPRADVRRRAFRALLGAEREARFPATLARFLSSPDVLFDNDTIASVCDTRIGAVKLDAIIKATADLCREPAGDLRRDAAISSLFRFLARYGGAHPSAFHRLRSFLTHQQLFAPRDGLRVEARLAMDEMLQGFREWLGPNTKVAVDGETGEEYGWREAVRFDDRVPADARKRLLSAIATTPMLREALFLFSRTSVDLSDLYPGSVWVRELGSGGGKTVFRVTVQTRFQGAHDIAVNLNHDLSRAAIEEETQWLILCGGAWHRPPLAEDFGGYHEQQDLWTEEFIFGETLQGSLSRLSKRPGGRERITQIWPHLAWSTLTAYVDFWNRTGRRWEIADPDVDGVVVPIEDYQTGARLVSVTLRQPHDGMVRMLQRLRRNVVDAIVTRHPELEGVVGWDVVFSALIEVVGEQDGAALLREVARSMREAAGTPETNGEVIPLDRLERFIDSIETHGFVPMRLYFAIERYRRWEALTTEPTAPARARTLQELYGTYGLPKLLSEYPEARVRFFRKTVLRDASDPLAQGLEDILQRLRRRELVGDALIDAIADLRAHLQLDEDEDYFLARLSFPHLRPEDMASFVDADFGGRQQSEMVVLLKDKDGGRFRVRHALNPREVGRLHRLFAQANLDVVFRMEHQYLVAINDRSQVVGGVFYEIDEDAGSAHLEKIAVAEAYRHKGVADGLMRELLNRVRAAGVRAVTTGFFRQEYFYRYGFKIEKRFAGLVKTLDD